MEAKAGLRGWKHGVEVEVKACTLRKGTLNQGSTQVDESLILWGYVLQL
jgi:hypothetical protein